MDSHNTGIIYFAAGQYNEELGIRHSKNASTAKKDNNSVSIAELNESTPGVYNYYRTVENLTLIADDEAVFKKDFKVHVGHVYGDSAHGIIGYDPVRKIELLNTNTSFYSHIDIDGIKFVNMKFVDSARLYFHYSSLNSHARNIEIEGCSFTGLKKLKADNKYQAIKFNTDTTKDIGHMFENLKISDCQIKTYYQGIYTQCLDNIAISGCDISDIDHNAIAVQSSPVPGGNMPFTGDVLIDGNSIKEGTDRAIRFGDGENAKIVISNNTIDNVCDDKNQILKAGTLTNCTHEFIGNTYVGETLKEETEPVWIISF